MAIAGSIKLGEGSSHFMMDTPKVIECAMVKDVTTDKTSTTAELK